MCKYSFYGLIELIHSCASLILFVQRFVLHKTPRQASQCACCSWQPGYPGAGTSLKQSPERDHPHLTVLYNGPEELALQGLATRSTNLRWPSPFQVVLPLDTHIKYAQVD